MSKMISDCPACGGKLQITTLYCPDCGMELKGDFEPGRFDSLNERDTEFLLSFLRQRGNISATQDELGISYPTARKRLDHLLITLELMGEEQLKKENEEVIDMSTWIMNENSHKASDIIKRKLVENGGRVIVHTARGLPCEIRVAPDGASFISDKLPMNPPYRYEVFDIVVELLIEQGGRARKGNGRNYKLGEPECDETTVVGAIGYRYAHKETGKSVFDPVFVLAAVLEWAGVVSNERGELVLTASYRDLLAE